MHQTFINWANDPTSIRLYLVYLVIVCGVGIWRFLTVLRHLYRAQRPGKLSWVDVCNGKTTPEEVGMAIFAGKITAPFAQPAEDPSGKGDIRVQMSASLEIAEKIFTELCTVTSERARKIKYLVVQILLVSGLLLSFRARGLARGDYQFGLSTVPGSVLLFEQLTELFSVLALGLLLCVILYGLWGYLDSSVMRRRTKGVEFFRWGRKAQSGETT